MDDLVDEATDRQSAEQAIQQCYRVLQHKFSESAGKEVHHLEDPNASPKGSCNQTSGDVVFSVNLLPACRLTIEPFFALLAGLETDLDFSAKKGCSPIKTEADLEAYAYHVAGSVAASILELVFQHYRVANNLKRQDLDRIKTAGETMGRTLQYVNIARDIGLDAAIGRVYIPTSWLSGEGITPEYVLSNLDDPRVAKLRLKMLDKADSGYFATIEVISELPKKIRGPLRTVVDSYTAIGKTIRLRPEQMKVGEKKLKLSLVRRLVVAWQAMTHT